MQGLKTILWICAVGCLTGFVFAALPWPAITAVFGWFGLDPPTNEPITVFMFRLTMAISGLIGVFFVILALDPLRYGAMLSLAAYGLMCYAVFCLAGGIRYGLPLWTYCGDVIFGAVVGVLLLVFRKQAMQADGD